MHLSVWTITAVGAGGFLGAVTRFYIGVQIAKSFPHQIPIATLIVNISGSFFIGMLTALFLHMTPSEETRAFLITGFLGALTTYSAFAIESYMLLNSSFWYGVLNIILNAVGAIVFAAFGFKLIEKIL